MSNLPTTKPSNPLKDAITRAYRRQQGKCCCCEADISTGYYIENPIDNVVVLMCERCEREQRQGRAS